MVATGSGHTMFRGQLLEALAEVTHATQVPMASCASIGCEESTMLILQGARDYQVTVEDDFLRWQTGLRGRHGVSFCVLEHFDHFFFPGIGQSTPEDYLVPTRVDPAATDAICDWIEHTSSAVSRAL